MPEGLRARKRRAAMRHIQAIALDLFDEHGFDGVTIERIAAAAEVSPSSVYRYFGTKEGVVVYDPNESAISELRAPMDSGRPLLVAFRVGIENFLAAHGDGEDVVDRRRVRYLVEVPSVQAAVARRMFGEDSVLATYVAERLDRPVHDLAVQVSTGALQGALLGALRHWHATDYTEPLGEVLDRTFEALRTGFDLD